MKKILLLLFVSLGGFIVTNAQVVSMRVIQSSYSETDPDGAGLATGIVSFRFELMASSPVLADGVGLSVVFQSDKLMATPTNTTLLLGPLASAAAWVQGVDNRAGSPITPVNYGGQSFDTRMLVTFNQAQGIPNATIPPTWTAVCEVTYWTKGNTYPNGGYIVNQPGSVVAQNELSSDGGLSTYPLESPNLNTPIPLGAALPVLFSQFEAKCSNNGTAISWSTEQEANSAYFELERSINGTTWKTLGRTPAAGNSTSTRKYNQLDLEAGNAMYRVKQVDKDGQVIYTNIERANCQVKNVSAVIYPVPATDVLNVVIKSDKAVRTQLMVFEISGKLVKRLDANVQNGTNNFSIDLKGLTSGDYILKSSDAGIELNKQFTIIR